MVGCVFPEEFVIVTKPITLLLVKSLTRNKIMRKGQAATKGLFASPHAFSTFRKRW